MRRYSTVLAIVVGLGCCFFGKCSTEAAAQTSAKPPQKTLDPFERYLANTNDNRSDPAVEAFENSCGLDPKSSLVRFAQRPGDRWKLVRNLKDAQKDQETDFYGTLAVYHSADRIAVVEWEMELDVGNYSRSLYCLDHEQVVAAESTSWTVDVTAPKKATHGWGYDHRWRLDANGKFVTTAKGFVDLNERSVAALAVGAKARSELDGGQETISEHTWKELKYPDAVRK